ncbi:hypothetical protein GOBAR_AA21617 [Gossypium barbadense]|uniref:Uncharacterized protein n=1 Tax=Gossypium barbadense TaxID=3634 RepID=A0A2P5X6V1_GOSBA|nr:hypothetical protein GOBAR_AA21617 [Gossypium barbadense]
MKTALFLAITSLVLGSTIASDEFDPVLDISGQELRTGIDYYILPQQEVSNGLPLTFSPVNVTQGVVRVSTDLNIKFSAASICVQTTLWTLHFDESVQKYIVTTGGVEGNPGRETLSNWFKIQKFEDDYRLVYCPTVCNFCRPVCGALGVFMDGGTRRLAISDEPLKVMFKRA